MINPDEKFNNQSLTSSAFIKINTATFIKRESGLLRRQILVGICFGVCLLVEHSLFIWIEYILG